MRWTRQAEAVTHDVISRSGTSHLGRDFSLLVFKGHQHFAEWSTRSTRLFIFLDRRNGSKYLAFFISPNLVKVGIWAYEAYKVLEYSK